MGKKSEKQQIRKRGSPVDSKVKQQKTNKTRWAKPNLHEDR